jgi:hypothetical protein
LYDILNFYAIDDETNRLIARQALLLYVLSGNDIKDAKKMKEGLLADYKARNDSDRFFLAISAIKNSQIVKQLTESLNDQNYLVSYSEIMQLLEVKNDMKTFYHLLSCDNFLDNDIRWQAREIIFLYFLKKSKHKTIRDVEHISNILLWASYQDNDYFQTLVNIIKSRYYRQMLLLMVNVNDMDIKISAYHLLLLQLAGENKNKDSEKFTSLLELLA